MKLASSRSLGRGERIGWRNMIPLDDKPSSRKCSIHILAFTVDGWINLVRKAVVALIALESDIVRGRNAPQRPPVDLVRRFPDSQVIPRHRNSHWLGVGESVVLRSAKKKQCAHRHRQIVFLFQRVHHRIQRRIPHFCVDLHPLGRSEHLNHLVLRSHNQDVYHVAGFAGGVGNAARDFAEQVSSDAGHAGFNGTSGIGGTTQTLVQHFDFRVEAAFRS